MWHFSQNFACLVATHLLSDNFHTYCLYLKCILRVNDQGAQPKFFQDFIFKFWIWALMLMGIYWDVIVAWCNLWSLVKRGSRNGLRKLNLNHIFIKGFSLNLVFFLVMKPRVSGRYFFLFFVLFRYFYFVISILYVFSASLYLSL